MPRYYPKDNCDLYIEHLRDNYHDQGREILRKNQHINPVCWYDDPSVEDPHRSRMCTWGQGANFKQKTGFKCDKFIKSRIRRDNKLPIPGRRGLWKITQIGTAGMYKLPLHTWNLYDNWLIKSSFRKV